MVETHLKNMYSVLLQHSQLRKLSADSWGGGYWKNEGEFISRLRCVFKSALRLLSFHLKLKNAPNKKLRLRETRNSCHVPFPPAPSGSLRPFQSSLCHGAHGGTPPCPRWCPQRSPPGTGDHAAGALSLGQMGRW